MIQNPDPFAAIDYPLECPDVNSLWSSRFILALQNITAVFDGFKALDLHAFGIEHKELRVIIGPNGAGKTTFCDIVSGKTTPTTGQVYFDGGEITPLNEMAIALKGVGRKFQTPTVYDSLTTFENMELALPGNRHPFRNLIHRHSKQDRDRIFHQLERVRLADEAHTRAKYLSHGQRQWLAISSLILAGPKLLLVDEPAAGLTDAETALTAELLLELRGDHTVVVIEHDMDFVRQLQARVTVFNEGQILAEGSMETVRENEKVKEAYLGR
ncbi:MAG: urea ABC transporter ATP-binding protein UrtD [Kiritimatiellae bacterium]|jgi:urea transport system ATP-binding protein|nr:urea ABC transporter ATP-binding protein UrtD [Kiritimatiellia bacterium]